MVPLTLVVVGGQEQGLWVLMQCSAAMWPFGYSLLCGCVGVVTLWLSPVFTEVSVLCPVETCVVWKEQGVAGLQAGPAHNLWLHRLCRGVKCVDWNVTPHVTPMLRWLLGTASQTKNENNIP